MTRTDFDTSLPVNFDGITLADKPSETVAVEESAPYGFNHVEAEEEEGDDEENEDDDAEDDEEDLDDSRNNILETYLQAEPEALVQTPTNEDFANDSFGENSADCLDDLNRNGELGEDQEFEPTPSIPSRQQSLTRISVAKLLDTGYRLYFSDSGANVRQALEQWSGVLTSEERKTHLWAVLQALLHTAIASRELYAKTKTKKDIVNAYINGCYGFNLLVQYSMALYTTVQKREAQKRVNLNSRRVNSTPPEADFLTPNPYHLAWLQILHQLARSEKLANSLTAVQLAQRAGETSVEESSLPHQSTSGLGKLSWSLFSSSSMSSLPRVPLADESAKKKARTLVDRHTGAKERDAELETLLGSPHILFSPAVAYLLQEFAQFFIILHITCQEEVRQLHQQFSNGSGKFGDNVVLKPLGASSTRNVFGWLDIGLNLLARWHLAFPLPSPFNSLLTTLNSYSGHSGSILALAGSVSELLNQVITYHCKSGPFKTVNSWQDAALKNTGLKRSNSSPQNPDPGAMSSTGKSFLKTSVERSDTLGHQHSRSKSLTDASRMLASNASTSSLPSKVTLSGPNANDVSSVGQSTKVPLMRISYFHGQLLCFEAQLYSCLALALLHPELFKNTEASTFQPGLLDPKAHNFNSKSIESEADVSKLTAQELLRRAISLLNLLQDVLDSITSQMNNSAPGTQARSLKLLSLGRSNGIIPELQKKINFSLEFIHSVESQLSGN